MATPDSAPSSPWFSPASPYDSTTYQSLLGDDDGISIEDMLLCVEELADAPDAAEPDDSFVFNESDDSVQGEADDGARTSLIWYDFVEPESCPPPTEGEALPVYPAGSWSCAECGCDRRYDDTIYHCLADGGRVCRECISDTRLEIRIAPGENEAWDDDETAVGALPRDPRPFAALVSH